MIKVVCQSCEREMSFADQHNGKSGKCPDCKEPFRVEFARSVHLKPDQSEMPVTLEHYAGPGRSRPVRRIGLLLDRIEAAGLNALMPILMSLLFGFFCLSLAAIALTGIVMVALGISVLKLVFRLPGSETVFQQTVGMQTAQAGISLIVGGLLLCLGVAVVGLLMHIVRQLRPETRKRHEGPDHGTA